MLVATSAAAFTATLDNTVVAVALRDLQRDLGAGVTGLQGVVTAYTVALAALLLTGGALVDTLGARRVLLAGLAVFGLASLGCALSTTVVTLVACRARRAPVPRCCCPGGWPCSLPPTRTRSRGAGRSGCGPALVGPRWWPGPWSGAARRVVRMAVGLLDQRAVVVVVLAVVARTPAVAGTGRRLDVTGTSLTLVVLGAATTAVVLSGRQGLSGAVLAPLVVAAVGSVLLVRAERRAGDPVLPLDLVRRRRFAGAALGAFAASLAVFVLLVFLSLFLQLVQDRTALRTGLLLLPLPVAVALVAPLVGRWRATALPVAAGLLLAGAGLLGLGTTLSAATGPLPLGLLLAMTGAGVGLTSAPVVAAALAEAGPRRAGLAAATVNVGRELGGVVAVAGLGALAVSRLSARLEAALVGVSPGQRPVVLDALLSGRTKDVRRLLLTDLGLARTLAIGGRIAEVASASFVASTRLMLDGAGALLLLAAVACALLLRDGRPTRRAGAARPAAPPAERPAARPAERPAPRSTTDLDADPSPSGPHHRPSGTRHRLAGRVGAGSRGGGAPQPPGAPASGRPSLRAPQPPGAPASGRPSLRAPQPPAPQVAERPPHGGALRQSWPRGRGRRCAPARPGPSRAAPRGPG